ncbi:MAG: CHASE3 domain-containing protein [Cyclobacteriaceae bacterium]|nr:CHASE3 domain-containing protein [Cyclobacteriaceae bacterium]
MAITIRTRSRILYGVVVLIGFSLGLNVVLIYQNSRSIEINQQVLAHAEQAKLATLDLIRNLHLMDLALRGYALTGQEAQRAATDSAKWNHPRIIKRIRTALQAQGFPDINRLDSVQTLLTSYFAMADTMLTLTHEKKLDEFLVLLRANRGYNVWFACKTFSDEVTAYETTVVATANEAIQAALHKSYILQFLIFILATPSLAYLAITTVKAFRLTDDLREVQLEKNKLLQATNEELDRQVKEKTKDLFAQNEAIKTHNTQLLLQQDEIRKAHETIAQQANQIEKKNKELAQEVENQTDYLRIANQELIEQNSRLQQFTYIISHNLRAPLARLKGLANLMEYAQMQNEKESLYQKMVKSARDMDEVIQDLSMILNIQRQNTLTRSEVILGNTLQKVLLTLEDEIAEVKAEVVYEASNEKIISVAPYVESIIYNLLSNAIKYRSPHRPLKIELKTFRTDSWICLKICDNGLGIDLTRHGHELFNLYKRFHLHVEGKGLGLYLVKTEMDAIGGKIEVESDPSTGTCFILYFNTQQT